MYIRERAMSALPPVLPVDALDALEQALDECASAESIRELGSDFVARVLQPLMVGYALRSELESLPEAARGRLFELPQGELESELRAMVPVLLEPAARCVGHLLAVRDAVAQVEVARAGMAEYFRAQQRVIACLSRLVECSRSEFFRGAPLCLGLDGEQMEEGGLSGAAADDWLFRPLPAHEAHLSIVYLLCDSIYAALKSSVAVGTRCDAFGAEIDPEMLADCSQGRAEEMHSLCQVLVDIVSHHSWSSEDAGLLKHMTDLFDELSISLTDFGGNQPQQRSGLQPEALLMRKSQLQSVHVSCTVMVGAAITKILPNLASLLRIQQPPGRGDVSSVLDGLAKTTSGAGEGRQSGAMAYVHLLLAGAELQAQELAAADAGVGAEAYSLSILRGMSVQVVQRALLHWLHLLSASEGTDGDSSEQLCEATLGVWGAVLEAVRCCSAHHQQLSENFSVADGVEGEGGKGEGAGLCLAVIEVTSRLVGAQPQAAMSLWSSWQFHLHLKSWTMRAVVQASECCALSGGVGNISRNAADGPAGRYE